MGESVVGLNFALLGVGFLSGVSSSAPIGPINLWIINATLNRFTSSVKYFIAGVIVVDVAFASMAALSYYSLEQKFKVAPWIELIGGGFIFVVGLIAARKAIVYQPQPREETRSVAHSASSFLTGAALCGSNPAFLVFWVFIVNLAKEKLHLVPSDAANLQLSGRLLCWRLQLQQLDEY